jgi:hypothetical protein
MTNFLGVSLVRLSGSYWVAGIALAADPQKGEGTPGGAKANLSNLSDEKVLSKSQISKESSYFLM